MLSEEKARCVNKMRPFGEVKALLESQSFNRMSWDHEDLKDTWVFFEVRACGMLKDPRTGIWFFFCSIFRKRSCARGTGKALVCSTGLSISDPDLLWKILVPWPIFG